MLLSIDPGVRLAGCALWLDGKLHKAWMVRGLSIKKDRSYPNAWKLLAENVWKEVGGLATELAIEFPVAYEKHSLQKGDQNDLLQLSAAVGALVDKMSLPTKIYYPYEWKRQMPDHVTNLRINKRLDDTERRAVLLPTAESSQHNVWDGVGIGLHHLGRYLF